MNLLKKYIVALLVLALLVGSLASLRAFIMDNIVEPIALVFWAAWRIIVSVDQMVYWMILIAVCFLLVIRLVPGDSDNKLRGAYTYRYKSGNRVEYWKTLITNAYLGKEDAENFRHDLKKLLKSAIRESKESTPIDLKDIMAKNEIPLSPETQRFLFPPKQSSRESSLHPWLNGLLMLPAWRRRTIEQVNRRNSISMDEILRWLENEMEINDDK